LLFINLLSLNFSAVALIAELHGRMGYFPPIIRFRPVVGLNGQPVTPPRFEIAGVSNLQALRDEARKGR